MAYLLDTHIWLWAALEPERIPPAMARTIKQAPGGCWVSSVSLWETVQLIEKGRISLSQELDQMVAEQVESGMIRLLGMSPAVALDLPRVQLRHRDPADRLLLATARVHALTLITCDEKLLRAAPTDCWRAP